MSPPARRLAPALLSLIALFPLLTACDDDDDGPEPPCVLDGDCPDGRACAVVAGADASQCVAPVYITGQVIAAEDGGGVADARVLALGVNGEAPTGVVFTDAEGRYLLPVPADRDAEGRPLSERLTLRVDAAARQPFPVPPRVALPLDLGEAIGDAEAGWAVENAATTVRLFALPPAARGVTVSGLVDHPDAGGALLLAERGDRAVSTSIVDLDGGFVLYDVPPGAVSLVGLLAGLYLPPTAVDVPEAGLAGVVLGAEPADGVVQGSVSIVNAPGGAETSLILVPDSAFDAEVVRGPAVAGLRAAPVSGGFTGYELRVYDAFGALVHSDLEVGRVTGDDTVSASWGGPLEPGMLYQFRAASFREDGEGRRYISTTEDLRGVFRAPQ